MSDNTVESDSISSEVAELLAEVEKLSLLERERETDLLVAQREYDRELSRLRTEFSVSSLEEGFNLLKILEEELKIEMSKVREQLSVAGGGEDS